MQTGNKRTSQATCVEELDLWQKVTISKPDDANQVWFESRVDDSDKDVLYLPFPLDDSRMAYGNRTEVTFIKDECLYQFDAILDSGILDKRQYLTLHPTSGVRHVQRRTAARMDMRLKIEIARIQRPISQQVFAEDLNWQPSTTENFSAKGILTRVTSGFAVGDVVAIRLHGRLIEGAPKMLLSSWRRLAKIGETAFMGLQFITRERAGDFLLPGEIKLLSADLLQLTEAIIELFGKFVINYELKLRQQGKR